MDAVECLKILRQMKDVSFASVDEIGHPRVRIIDVMYVDNQKLVFCTARGKGFYNEIMRNPYVGITGMTQDYKMVRLHGQIKKLDQQKEWIDLIFDENPSMNDVYPNNARYVLEAFSVDNGEIEYFDLAATPINRMCYELGTNKEIVKGYFIQDQCIGCGLCQKVCPQQCIEAGKPYRIKQHHCLHCGLCYEKCPHEAIVLLKG